MDKRLRSINIVKELKQLSDFIKRNIKNEFEEMDLTGSQGMIIAILASNGSMKISDLSKKIGLSNSTVSGIIDRLEKQNYVERVRSKEDRRIVLVEITPKFREITAKHLNTADNKLDTIIQEATQEEAEKILEGLRILKRLLVKRGIDDNV